MKLNHNSDRGSRCICEVYACLYAFVYVCICVCLSSMQIFFQVS